MAEPQTGDMLNRADHDLLIRLDTKMDRSASDIAELHKHITTINTTMQALMQSVDGKIAGAVADRVGKAEFDEAKKDSDKLHYDHEKRLRRIERGFWAAIGVVGLIDILSRFIKIG